jgi:hypothetical protein
MLTMRRVVWGRPILSEGPTVMDGHIRQCTDTRIRQCTETHTLDSARTDTLDSATRQFSFSQHVADNTNEDRQPALMQLL